MNWILKVKTSLEHEGMERRLGKKAASEIMLILLTIGMLSLAFNIELAKAEVQVGVKTGDWIKLEYTISGWPSGQPYPEWLKIEFLTVEGTNATVKVTMHMSNGTEQNATVAVTIGAEGGEDFGLSGFVIPANLTVGDFVYISGYGNVTIAGETTAVYAGATRTVVYARFLQYGIYLTYYWDKLTGVMVEASVVSGDITGTAKATETNMWPAEITYIGQTIYIRSNGSIDPPNAPITTYDNITYTLTDNITSSADGIVVERDNIIIDGAGYTLQGTKAYLYKGIYLDGRSNVIIKNITITTFFYGIRLYYSSNNSICGNTIANSWAGVWLGGSSNNTISRNSITANDDDGIELYYSSNNIISGNTFVDDGLVVSDSYRNVVEDNTVNGKPLVYFEGVVNYSVGDAEQVILVNCTSIRVENLNLSHTSIGVQLWNTNNTIISGNTIAANNLDGIRLSHSSNNVISENTIANNDDGLRLFDSSNNTISGNSITANNCYGIELFHSSNNVISENTIAANNFDGVWLDASYNNLLYGNNIANNDYGIGLYYSSNNIISGNSITANDIRGLRLSYSSNNIIYHNNFLDNAWGHVDVWKASGNIWDDGYPSGGNYWSGYGGTDADGDGIGDIPYVIDYYNRDCYPLMGPFDTFDVGIWNGEECSVDVVSNSTVSTFQLNTTQKTISFNVTGIEGAAGFCRITIPNIIVQDLWQGDYTVLFNGEPWPYRNWTDATNTYIYVNYTHSEHQIVIIPEFPSIITLLSMLIVISIIVPVKRKVLRRRFPT